MLLSHSAVIGLLSIALWSLRVCHQIRDRDGVWGLCSARYIFAGFACSMAIASEYDSAFVAGGMLWLTWIRGSKPCWQFLLGCSRFVQPSDYPTAGYQTCPHLQVAHALLIRIRGHERRKQSKFVHPSVVKRQGEQKWLTSRYVKVYTSDRTLFPRWMMGRPENSPLYPQTVCW